jgi:hypothetical protein
MATGLARTVAGEHLLRASLPRLESARSARGRLPNGEIRSRTGLRLLPFVAWQRRSNQPSVHGPFHLGWLAIAIERRAPVTRQGHGSIGGLDGR